MKYVNPRNLPWPIVESMEQAAEAYSPGDSDITVTQLVDSPRIRILLDRYGKELEVDVVDRIFAFQGQLIHEILSNLPDKEGRLKETRFYATVAGKKLGGQIDLFDAGQLIDFKYTFTHALKEGVKPGWVAQVNLYRYLLEVNGVAPVTEQKICSIYRDWTPTMSLRPSVPDLPGEFHEVPIWSKRETERYIKNRLEAHYPVNGFVPDCSLEERWQKEDWALIKPGANRAYRALESEQEALEELKKAPGGYKVVHRLKPPIRCERCCSVSGYCTQYKAMKEAEFSGLMKG